MSFTIDLSDYEIATRDLQFLEKIGEGSFASVHKAVWRGRGGGKLVAVKKIQIPPAVGNNNAAIQQFKQTVLSETAMMWALNYDYILRVYGAIVDDPYSVSIVMEYMENGSVFELIHNQNIKSIPWSIRWMITRQAALALNYLHSRKVPIIHRDVKSLNLLLDKDLNTRVCDFGFAKTHEELVSSVMSSATTTTTNTANPTAGTVRWCAPEVMAKRPKWTTKADVYSLAITMWELVTRKIPFQETKDNSLIPMIVRVDNERPEIPRGCRRSFRQLIEWCWAKNPDDRPSCQQILEYMDKHDAEYSPENDIYDEVEETVAALPPQRNRPLPPPSPSPPSHKHLPPPPAPSELPLPPGAPAQHTGSVPRLPLAGETSGNNNNNNNRQHRKLPPPPTPRPTPPGRPLPAAPARKLSTPAPSPYNKQQQQQQQQQQRRQQQQQQQLPSPPPQPTYLPPPPPLPIGLPPPPEPQVEEAFFDIYDTQALLESVPPSAIEVVDKDSGACLVHITKPATPDGIQYCDALFNKVESAFMQFVRHLPATFTVREVIAIINPAITERFRSTEKLIASKCRGVKDLEPVSGTAKGEDANSINIVLHHLRNSGVLVESASSNPVLAWFGTTADQLPAICASGLSPSILNNALHDDRDIYGEGIYLTQRPLFLINRHNQRKSGTDNSCDVELVLTWTLLGKPHVVTKVAPKKLKRNEVRLPAPGCNSHCMLVRRKEATRKVCESDADLEELRELQKHHQRYLPVEQGEKAHGDQIVIFDSSQVLPQFVVRCSISQGKLGRTTSNHLNNTSTSNNLQASQRMSVNVNGSAAAPGSFKLTRLQDQNFPLDYDEACKMFNILTKNASDEPSTNLSMAQGQQNEQRLMLASVALRWYTQLASKGNHHAQTILGRMYECGCGVKVMYDMALYWYNRAAEAHSNNPQAQFNLGLMHLNGYGIPHKDHKSAKIWFTKAADQGFAKAVEALRIIAQDDDNMLGATDTGRAKYKLLKLLKRK